MSVFYEVETNGESRIKKYPRWCDRFGPFETADGRRGVGAFTMVRYTSNETPYTLNLRCLHSMRKKAYGKLPEKCNVFAVIRKDGSLIRRRYVHNHLPLESSPKALFDVDNLYLEQSAPSLIDVLSLLSTDGRGRKRKMLGYGRIPQIYEILSSDDDGDEDDGAEQEQSVNDRGDQECFSNDQLKMSNVCPNKVSIEHEEAIILSDSNDATSSGQEEVAFPEVTDREVEHTLEQRFEPLDSSQSSSSCYRKVGVGSPASVAMSSALQQMRQRTTIGGGWACCCCFRGSCHCCMGRDKGGT
ncbi:hypothetical protein BIW11_07154, partial [Tropilaelaps mercedesae]